MGWFSRYFLLSNKMKTEEDPRGPQRHKKGLVYQGIYPLQQKENPTQEAPALQNPKFPVEKRPQQFIDDRTNIYKVFRGLVNNKYKYGKVLWDLTFVSSFTIRLVTSSLSFSSLFFHMQNTWLVYGITSSELLLLH